MRRTIELMTLVLAIAVPVSANATTYVIQLSGMCSNGWYSAPGGSGGGSNGGSPQAGTWSGIQTLSAPVDETNSLSTAAGQFKAFLDQKCTGSNNCYIFNYSAGDNVAGYTFARLAWNYNITYILTSAGAGGGSNLAGTIASVVTCPFANGLTETNARGAYNHQATKNYNAGVASPVYRLGGNRQMFASNAACVVGSAINFLTFGLVQGGTCLQSHNDGAVSYQSSGAYNNSGDYSNFFDSAYGHWAGHTQWWTNTNGYGDGLNHYNMKMWGVCVASGMPSVSSTGDYNTCFNWSLNN